MSVHVWRRSTELRQQEVQRLRSAELLRLGFVMALAMTLHNMPEGFAVRHMAHAPCFSVYSHPVTLPDVLIHLCHSTQARFMPCQLLEAMMQRFDTCRSFHGLH